MIILGIVLNIINLYDINNHDTINISLILLIEVIYSLSMVKNKYITVYKFSSPYEISFCQGLFALIANIIILFICTNMIF